MIIAQTEAVMNWAFTQGLAVVLLLGLCIVLVWAGRGICKFFRFWFEKIYSEIIVPGKQELTTHLEEASKLANRNADCIEKLSGTMSETCRLHQETHKLISEVHDHTVAKRVLH